MPPGFNQASEKAKGFPPLKKMVPHDPVAGLRLFLVVGPRTSAQIGEGANIAVNGNDHFREVDGPAAVTLADEDRGSQWFQNVVVFDVRQAANESEVDVAQLGVILT